MPGRQMQRRERANLLPSFRHLQHSRECTLNAPVRPSIRKISHYSRASIALTKILPRRARISASEAAGDGVTEQAR